VLRGLTIDGAGALADGIHVTAVGTLFVDRCVITNFAGLSGPTGHGIALTSSGYFSIQDTTIRGNENSGVAVLNFPASGLVRVSIDNCRLEDNFEGIRSNGGGSVTISNSVASGNLSSGFAAFNGGEINVESCVAAHNEFGAITYTPDSVVRLSNTTLTDNDEGVAGNILSRGNNTVEGSVIDGTFSGTYSAK
jgi:hypothetical protein